MTEFCKKRSRKTKLVPRECGEVELDKVDDDLQSLQAVASLLPKLKTELDKDQVDESPEQSPMELSVAVEVEEWEEDHKSEPNPPQPVEALDFINDCTKGVTQNVAIFSSSQIYFKESRLRQAIEELSQRTTSIQDKIIETGIRNAWGDCLERVTETPGDELLKDVIKTFKTWVSQTKFREHILSFKCYVCDLGWWNLGPFRDHILRHKNVKVDLETFYHECCFVAYYKVTEPRDVPIEGDCPKCMRNVDQHVILKNMNKAYVKETMYYRCAGCHSIIYTCSALVRHEGVCQKFQKILFNKDLENKTKVFHESLYRCNICSLNCLTIARLQAHYSLGHTPRTDELAVYISCKSCQFCKVRYFIHNLHNCKQKLSNFLCMHCSRRFRNKALLDHHIVSNLASEYCKVCHKYLHRKCMELEHMLMHSDNYMSALKCGECKNTILFPNLPSYKLHRRRMHTHKNNLKHERVLPNKAVTVIVPKSVMIRRDDLFALNDETWEEQGDVNDQNICTVYENTVKVESIEKDVDEDTLIEQDEREIEELLQKTIKREADDDSKDYAKSIIIKEEKAILNFNCDKLDNYYVDINHENANTEFPENDEDDDDIMEITDVKSDIIVLNDDSSDSNDDNPNINLNNDNDRQCITKKEADVDDNHDSQSLNNMNSDDPDLNDDSLIIDEDDDDNMEPICEIKEECPDGIEYDDVDIKEEEGILDDELSKVFQASIQNKSKKPILDEIKTEVVIKEETIDEDSEEFEDDILLLNQDSNEIEEADLTEPLTDSTTVQIKPKRVNFTDPLLWKTPYCSKCKKEFSSFKRYCRHFNTVHKLKHAWCPICKETFRKLEYLGFHIQKKHVKPSYVQVRYISELSNAEPASKFVIQCKECQDMVTMEDCFKHWELHLKLETDDGETEDFEKEFGEHYDFEDIQREENHVVKRLTSDEVRLIYESLMAESKQLRTCVMCHRAFNRRNDCKRHLIEHLLEDAMSTRPLRCQLCEKGYGKPHMFRQHMRHEHASLPIFKCNICNKMFSDSSNFTKHKKVHNLGVFICDICGKKFSIKTTLAKHMEEHSRTSPLPCAQCPRVFSTHSAFRRHERSHSKRSNYKCEFCPRKFDACRLKWDHMWEVHKQRKHKADCPFCGKSFRKFNDVRQHVQDEHPNELKKGHRVIAHPRKHFKTPIGEAVHTYVVYQQ